MKIKDYTIGNLSFEVFKLEIIDERMYVLRCNNNVLIIDPHEDMILKNEIEVDSNVTILLTHEHFDHISGVNFYKRYFACEVMCSQYSRQKLNAADNGTSRFPLLFIGNREEYAYVKNKYSFPYRPIIDGELIDGQIIDFCGNKIKALYTPGHSCGGMSYVINEKILFAGDNLLGNGQELRSIDSDKEEFEYTLGIYEKMLNKDVALLPGHGEISSLDEVYAKVRSYI